MNTQFLKKYQPLFFKDFTIDKEYIELLNTLNKMDSLNILLVGNIGSGKTSILYATIREYYNMKDIPSDIPLDVNPREPKMTTNVAKNLINAVTEPETDFYINNRGIVLSAKSLSFDTSASEVTIDLGQFK